MLFLTCERAVGSVKELLDMVKGPVFDLLVDFADIQADSSKGYQYEPSDHPDRQHQRRPAVDGGVGEEGVDYIYPDAETDEDEGYAEI